MPLWKLVIHLDPALDKPLYLQLADAIAERVEQGSLPPGAALPGSRALAEQLGIHRNTVLAAFRELVSQGWIQSRGNEGTFVCEEPPAAHREVLPPAAPHSLAVPAVKTAMPDGRLLPSGAFARAYRWALKMIVREGPRQPDPRGSERLRAALVDMLAYSRGLPVSPEDLMVTPGGGAALSLVVDTLLAPGDGVAVEALSYPPAVELFRSRGLKVEAVPVDGDGLDVEALARLLEHKPLRAVFLTPQRQYPTLVTLSRPRREALLALARRHSLHILEYDHDTEFHFDGQPPLPLASQDRERVVYLSALSKLFAPGMRLGLLHGPPTLLGRIAEKRAAQDLGGDPVLEWAVLDLLESGELLRHLNRSRRAYRARRDHLVAALDEALRGKVQVAIPSGGLALWLRWSGSPAAEAWARAAENRGILFAPADRFAVAEPCPEGARLPFGHLEPEELDALAAGLAESRSSLVPRSGCAG